jgi:hypothetical protein
MTVYGFTNGSDVGCEGVGDGRRRTAAAATASMGSGRRPAKPSVAASSFIVYLRARSA